MVGAVELKPKIGEDDGVLVDATNMGAEALEPVAAEDPPNKKVGDEEVVNGDEEVVNEELKTGAELGAELGACQFVPNRGELVVPLELAEEFVELS